MFLRCNFINKNLNEKYYTLNIDFMLVRVKEIEKESDKKEEEQEQVYCKFMFK